MVVDASIAAKWVIEEEDTELAFALADGELLAPTLLLLECGNAIWARVRRGEVPPHKALERLGLLEEVPITYHASEALVDDALTLAVQLEHPIYDCTYLALAIRHDLRMVTADQLFVRAVRRQRSLGERVVTLGEAVAN